MEVPTINIPPRVRFVLYIAASLAGLLSIYFADKGFTWWGPAEDKLVTGVIALVNLLAAAKTTAKTLTAAAVPGQVLDRDDDTSGLDSGTVIEGGL